MPVTSPVPVTDISEQGPNASGVAHGPLFERLAELTDAGVVFLNGERDIEFINPEARKLLGGTEEHVPTACWDPVRTAFEEILESDSHKGEAHFEREGHTHAVLLEAHAIDEDPCTGYLVLVKDPAAMSRLKEDLELASRFRNTGQLYEAVAHNLRHPVSTILIRIDLLQSMIGGDEPMDPELQTRSLQAIKKEIRELDTTLRMLLEDFSPTGEEEQAFNLCKTIADLARLIGPQARQQDVAFDVDMPDEELIVRGQRMQLKQAVLNLAVNALEALPGGGTLRLALTGGDDTTVHIEVSDDGPGIPGDVRTHIFESHYTTKQDGTGIGLHLVKETVNHHGGTIDLETAPGDGCIFRLGLPICEA